MLQRAAQKRKVTVTSKIAKRSKHRRSKIAERSKHRVASLRRSRNDVIGVSRNNRSIAKRCYRRSRSDRSIAKRCSRGIADDDAPGVKGRSPPARHHRAIADAPRGIILLTSRVSIYLYSGPHPYSEFFFRGELETDPHGLFIRLAGCNLMASLFKKKIVFFKTV